MPQEVGSGLTPPWSRFTVAAPTGEQLADDVVVYGADLPAEPVLRLLGPLEGRRVLNLGCGAGHGAIAVARMGAHTIAVDPSPLQIAATRRAAEHAEVNVELHESDLADLAFLRKDAIDVAFSAYALSEIDDLDRVFRQVHRVLKSECALVFSLPHPAYVMLDQGEPLSALEAPRLARRYRDKSPLTWDRGDQVVTDYPRPIADVFVRLIRANFRVDTLLEPDPVDDGTERSRHWRTAMSWAPPTVVFRARKQGI